MYIKKKIKKVAKGYRLKPRTHSLIKELQLILQTDQDTVISRACRMMMKEVQKKMKIKSGAKAEK